MNALDQILNIEENEEDRCEKCASFRYGFKGPYCVYMKAETSPNSICGDYEFSDFWRTKRGY